MSANPNSDSESPEASQTDAVDVINRTAVIENVINQIIIGYCKPRVDAWEFMWSVVLDTSVMSLGAKAKVLSAISHELDFKIDVKNLHLVIELRNAFAHHSTNAHPVMRRGKFPEQSTSYYELWVLRTSGKFIRKQRNQAFDEFNTAYRKTLDSLVKLTDLIHAKFQKAVDQPA